MAAIIRWLHSRRWFLLGSALALYLIPAAYLYAVQRAMLFIPDTTDITPFVGRLPGAEAVIITTADGERLNAWWKPPQDPASPVYLYLHGNGANVARRAGRYARLTGDGAGLLALSWRGYGGSSGAPSEAGLRLDAAAARAWLGERVAGERIILFGESLGTGVAIRLAAEQPAKLLVLDSPYASIVALGQRRFPWLPVAWLARDPFRAIDDAPRVTIPVIAAHCRDDFIIPLEEAERLMRAFPTPPRLSVIEDRCHVPNIERALLPKIRAALNDAPS
jgi:pimeloyl-ACP methyl ester carboxylesterase